MNFEGEGPDKLPNKTQFIQKNDGDRRRTVGTVNMMDISIVM